MDGTIERYAMRQMGTGTARRLRCRSGVALLEVIVALTIIAICGVTATAMVHQTFSSIESARRVDHELRRANAFLALVTLWPREDLERRLGSHSQGDWVLQIDHPSPSLYRVALYDSTRAHLLLESAIFAPDTTGRRP